MKSALAVILVVLCVATGCSDDNPAGPSDDAARVTLYGTVIDADGHTVTIRVTMAFERIERLMVYDSDRLTFVTGSVSVVSSGHAPAIETLAEAVDGRPMSVAYTRTDTHDRMQGTMNAYVDAENRFVLAWAAQTGGHLTRGGGATLDDMFAADGQVNLAMMVDGVTTRYREQNVTISVRGAGKVADRFEDAR